MTDNDKIALTNLCLGYTLGCLHKYMSLITNPNFSAHSVQEVIIQDYEHIWALCQRVYDYEDRISRDVMKNE